MLEVSQLDGFQIALRVAVTFGGFALLVWFCVRAVRAARRGGKGMQAIGAAMMLFGFGSMRDPGNSTVAEAKDDRIRRDDDSGDPLNPP